jgi:LysM repeat protein
VHVNETVTISPTRVAAQDRLQRSDMEQRIAAGFTYNVAAVEILVNGVREALMRSQREADQVHAAITEDFTTDYTTYIGFVQPVDFRIYMVSSDFENFDSRENAIFRLQRPTGQHYPYVVQGGDMLGTIATRFDTTVTRIMSDNNLTSHIIQPGWVLQIYRLLPLLSIITHDEIVTETAAPMETQTVENSNLALAQTNILYQGRPGVQRATLRIVRVNGQEVARYYLDPEIIEPSIAEIIEVGTGEAQLDIRN